MTTALFIGRFQPFHNGHLEVVKKILEEFDDVVIAIGSAQESGSAENPYSAQERQVMITSALDEARISQSKYRIIWVEDVYNDWLWVSQVKKLANFKVVYSNNDWTIMCFRKADVEVVRHRMYNPLEYNGTRIRQLMAEGKEWRNLVPNAVARLICEKGENEDISDSITKL
ncbi:MAG: hypothetical protein MSIBF_05710 [Candidatus Altiarchaeales archaeon IMC4]|nr:MAG: hypothetical protein MSIBF_05710 [Candidatus Altiarchaeales archaeon IMC4]